MGPVTNWIRVPSLFLLEGIQNHVACFKFISSSCQTINWQPTLIMDNLTKKGSHIWMRIQRMSLWLCKNTDRGTGSCSLGIHQQNPQSTCRSVRRGSTTKGSLSTWHPELGDWHGLLKMRKSQKEYKTKGWETYLMIVIYSQTILKETFVKV